MLQYYLTSVFLLFDHYPLILTFVIIIFQSFLNTVPFTLSVTEMFITYVYTNTYGQILGFFLGFSVVLISTAIGSMIAFKIGRRYFRKQIKQMVRRWPFLLELEDVISASDLSTLILIRASPVPVQVITYFLSITDVKFKHFAIAVVGVGPHIFIHCLVGATCAHLEDILQGDWKNSTSNSTTIIVGLICLLCIAATIKLMLVIKAKLKALKRNKLHCPV